MPLVAKDLTYRFPGLAAATIKGLSLDLAPGRLLALCGAARSGRSTALALLAGLLTPTGGTVSVDGAAATAHEARGRVGLLLQNADEGLFGLTVREDVMFAPRQLELAEDEALKRADEALRVVQLDPTAFGQRSPFSLSGGQRRRAAMAGVMAMQPRYLLLDEPFAGLDPLGRREIITVIHGIATQRFGEHTGILVALSDLDLALHLADSLLVLHEGRAAWQGSVAAFIEQPPDVEPWGLRQPELVRLAGCLRGQGWPLRVSDPSPDTLADAIAAHVRGVRT